ncbi:hypothetical protein N7448_007339 [Penicillium atrosanguineum]|uniref:uncharacterized protein n=1 Tax=Penicillium atrosanguineum TaxID=1132637 RepID=UPI002396719E|nr:uncharacterized protein N7443_001631 [Penicillium atrosanguineum]KAJ5126560.1 hypothetical protein N7448_007339 [Penicillium atrosanguineum]KAJ5146761.1 hypothetical protein N7526_000113 [Penicillium atrosanguineum]KAJ5314747.1 hypothetical protein N7443_001631 [Penicillium atrosanguineum]
MSELRQRQPAAGSGRQQNTDADADTAPRREPRRTDDDDPFISVLDIIRVFVVLVIASCGLSYYMTNTESVLWGYRPWFTRWPVVKQYLSGSVHLTPVELSLYNGTDPSLPIYLAVNGSIFDVSANPMIYGPGGSYNFFAGRDATRAFVTGCFKEDLTTDVGGVEEMFLPVEDVEDEQITMAERTLRHERELMLAREQIEKTVLRWQNFFRNHKKYFEVGLVEDDGTVDPEKGKRVLCEGAKKQRPKRSEMTEEE